MDGHATITPEQWGDRLRERGLRITQGRIAALGYLDAHPHSSAAEIYAALAERLPSLSQQSVHNIANDLTEHGILRRVDLPDTGSALYETLRGDNHHHVQCVVCQRIEDVECMVGAAPCMTPHGDHGMRVLEASVTFRGVCADCEPELGSTARDGAVLDRAALDSAALDGAALGSAAAASTR